MSHNNASQANKDTDPLSNQLHEEDKLRQIQPTPPNTADLGITFPEKLAGSDTAASSPSPASFEDRLEDFEQDLLKELDSIGPRKPPPQPWPRQTEPDSSKRAVDDSDNKSSDSKPSEYSSHYSSPDEEPYKGKVKGKELIKRTERKYGGKEVVKPKILSIVIDTSRAQSSYTPPGVLTSPVTSPFTREPLAAVPSGPISSTGSSTIGYGSGPSPHEASEITSPVSSTAPLVHPDVPGPALYDGPDPHAAVQLWANQPKQDPSKPQPSEVKTTGAAKQKEDVIAPSSAKEENQGNRKIQGTEKLQGILKNRSVVTSDESSLAAHGSKGSCRGVSRHDRVEADSNQQKQDNQPDKAIKENQVVKLPNPPNQDPPDQQPPGHDSNMDGEKRTFEQTWQQEDGTGRPKWNDTWAGILFLLVCAGFTAVSGIALQGYAATRSQNNGSINGQVNNFGLTTHTIYLFCFVLAMAVVFSYIYMFIARRFTKAFIWITGILNIVFGLATAIYMLTRHYYSGGIVFLIFSVFTIFAFITWIPRIPFSVVMLQTAMDVAKDFGHVHTVTALGGLAGVAFGAWYSVTLVAIYVKFEPSPNNQACSEGVGGCGKATVIGLIVFVTFASYWITEWLKNTIHTTVSGIYGSWYFNSRNYPTGVTRGALRRALTYSFGSISLGSLLVAIINFLRQILQVARQQAAAEGGNFAIQCAYIIAGCFLNLLDWAVQFVNRYAFSHIALYGKPYFFAAKATWRMIKDRGIDALVNECLIGPVLSMGATFVGYSCGFLAYLYMVFTHPAYNADGAYTPVVTAFAFLIGLQVCNIFTTPISSGVDTIFVAAAWDPQVMMTDHPDLYQKMVQTYPHVQQAIHA